MRPLLCALAGLALLRAAGADAASHTDLCQRQLALILVVQTVEKTVEHLEAEVKGLLSQLEELAWNLPAGPFGPTPDLLGDDRF
ncbi:PREDICTED: placenta-specific protein 9 [Hipposideros armiger]|uniref:Placenta-specific protein 9 n=1 Tax=Hipposideros armiger TaxID=186990 RepID=A0A8B7Q230_HIPAR|nr:PREDICTED: placenta-specific protein 9 [Hipposideros armiger]